MERLNARPLGVAVFGASVALLLLLQSTQVGRFRARAVAEATAVQHAALVASFVSEVYVRPGDRVEPGTKLAELSPHFIERELAQVTAQIEQVIHEAALARGQLVVDEESWLDPGQRQRPSRPSLQGQTDALYAAQLEVLHTRRSQLLEDRSQLTVASRASGRVAFVAPAGSPVAVGTSVASVTPDHADEIVAYLPAGTDPALIEPGTPARLLDSRMAACYAPGAVQRRGAAVMQAPAQLEGFLRFPVHGMPVYISIPDGCELGVGQVLSVEFSKASS
jgi:multidrug resistance efflux pump